jgi:hypothetical protein
MLQPVKSKVDADCFSILISGVVMRRAAVFLLVMAVASLLLRPERSIIDRPIIEDSYYVFTVARNIASGHGVTIDGSTRTNGFQPLFTFLTVPAFVLAGGNKYQPVRYVLLLEWILFLATAYLLGIIAGDAFERKDPHRRTSLRWTTSFIYLSSLYIFMTHLNGLETGCLLFLYAAAWRYYQTGGIEQRAGMIKLGIILGLLVLARIDAAFFVAILALTQLMLRKGIAIGVRLERFALLSGIALVVSSPWWIYNLSNFGTLMPSSGSAEQAWALSFLRMKAAIISLFQDVVPMVYLSRFEYFFWQGKLGASLLRIALVIAVLAVIWKKRGQQKERLEGDKEKYPAYARMLEFGACLLVFSLVLALWYITSSWAVHFYNRYFAPIFLPSTLVFGYLLHRFIEIKPRLGYALFAALCLPVLLSVGILHSESGYNGNTNYCDQLQLVNQVVPEGEWVAAGQSATLGYFRDHVINLDGKVNGEALLFQENMDRYLSMKGISWVCDWPDYVSQYLGERPEALGWKRIAEKRNFILYHFEG